jgi:hypothetical protein
MGKSLAAGNAMNFQLSLRLVFALAAFHMMLLAGPADTAAPQNTAASQGCVVPAKRMERLELIFGLSSKQGPVTPRAWKTFVAREVTPRFPDGFNIFEGHGQWRDKQGKIGQEPSRLLLIWYEADATSDTKIEAIRDAYKKRFHQESVLRANEPSCVSF